MNKRINLLVTVILSLFLITGCGAAGWYRQIKRLPPEKAYKKGIYHIVKPGQTLWRIAKTYGVSLDEIASINKIENTTFIKKGQHIFIPGATEVLEVEIYKPPDDKTKEFEEVKTHDIDFIWPVKGKIISGFGRRGKSIHKGIDIKAAEGTDFVACADGVVGYSGRLNGYGNVIIIKHNEMYTTVYAHNLVNLVKEGEKVKQNMVIGKVGATGRATTAHLHFEIRRQGQPQNPILYLP